MKVDRNEPFPQERKASKAELAVMVHSGGPVQLPLKEKKQKVEGGSSRLGVHEECYYKDFLG